MSCKFPEILFFNTEFNIFDGIEKEIMGKFHGTVVKWAEILRFEIWIKKTEASDFEKNWKMKIKQRCMVPVAREVLKATALLIRGISTLINIFPIHACK